MTELERAALALLTKINDMTTDEFSKGDDRVERRGLHAELFRLGLIEFDADGNKRQGGRATKQAEIISWLNYWRTARMVDIDDINAFDQVHLARKYCSCMRVGVFTPELVTDLQIWRALQVMRGAHPEWKEVAE